MCVKERLDNVSNTYESEHTISSIKDTYKYSPHRLVDPYIVYEHTSGHIFTHVVGHSTRTLGIAAVETITRTALGTGRGKAPGAADGGV